MLYLSHNYRPLPIHIELSRKIGGCFQNFPVLRTVLELSRTKNMQTPGNYILWLAHQVKSNTMGRKSVPIEKKLEIAALLKVCPTVTEVARRAEVSRQCVRNVAEKITNGESLANRIGQGRHRSTTIQDDRSLKIMAKRGRTQSLRVLASQWGLAVGKHIGKSTVSRRLIEMGLSSYVQHRKPFRTQAQVEARRKWCAQMQVWNKDQWWKVIWSDESHFEFINRNNRTYVRRSRTEENCSFNFRPRLQGGGGQVSVWGCFTAAGPGPILFYDGRLSSSSYVSLISAALPQFIDEKFGGRNDDYYFQQDNAPCHKAKATIQWFQEQGIRLLPWPPTSPDMNPIENI